MSLTKNILLIDDDATFVFVTKKIIANTNIPVKITEFNDGLKAINFLKENFANDAILPDVILLDLNMPIMNGWGFLEEYIAIEHKINKQIRIYIVSSSISYHDVERSKQYDAVSDFVRKPIDTMSVIEILEDSSVFNHQNKLSAVS
jgi:CheY-like chemotaxis protein